MRTGYLESKKNGVLSLLNLNSRLTFDLQKNFFDFNACLALSERPRFVHYLLLRVSLVSARGTDTNLHELSL